MEDEDVQEILFDFMNKVIIWLDAIASTKAKYYDMVKVENYDFLIEEWTPYPILSLKAKELTATYEKHFDTYIEYVFYYQFSSFKLTYKEITAITANFNKCECLSSDPKYTRQYFTKLMSTIFESNKGYLLILKRIIKHFAKSKRLMGKAWKKLMLFVKSIHSNFQIISTKSYTTEIKPWEEFEKKLQSPELSKMLAN